VSIWNIGSSFYASKSGGGLVRTTKALTPHNLQTVFWRGLVPNPVAWHICLQFLYFNYFFRLYLFIKFSILIISYYFSFGSYWAKKKPLPFIFIFYFLFYIFNFIFGKAECIGINIQYVLGGVATLPPQL